MDFWLLIISYGIFQGIFISIFFLISKRIGKTQKYLAIALIVSVLLLCTDYVISNYFIQYKEIPFRGIGWSGSFWYTLGPLYYLLFYSFLKGVNISIKKALIHFVPFLVLLVFSFPFLMLPAQTRQDYLLSYSYGQEITMLHIISKAVYHIQLLIYPLLIFSIINKKRLFKLNFISIINYCLLILALVSYVHLISFNVFHLSISWFTSTFIFISLTLFIQITTIVLMIRPKWIYTHVEEVISKYNISNLSNLDTRKVQDELLKLMNQEKVYLQHNLGLSDLSKKLLIKPHQLSEFLNQEKNQSFNDYVNSHRINDAQELLINLEVNFFKIDSIASEVGFSSPSAFYRNFKKLHKLTPTEWLKNQY